MSLSAINCAFKDINLDSVSRLFSKYEMSRYINTWPGEHYRLLSAFIKILQPKVVIEIGTATGASCLCMKKYLPKSAKIFTFDIIPWREYPETGLKESDFDSQLEQKVQDLTIGQNTLLHYDLFKNADFIFIDAAKDGRTEQFFCNFFDSIKFNGNPIVVFDDIKFINMLKIWHSIRHPKLDITSFGHWSGTGIVDWNSHG